MSFNKRGSPPLKILVRERGSVAVWKGPPFTGDVGDDPMILLSKDPCTSAQYSEDGSRLLIESNSSISIYDGITQKVQLPEPHPKLTNILAASLSPCGTYLQTFAEASSPKVKNVILWDTKTWEQVYTVFQLNMTVENWPTIRFSSDEAVAYRMATNELQFFDTSNFSNLVRRIKIPGVALAELSKKPGSYVAAFVPGSEGEEGSIAIYASASGSPKNPVARRSFFRSSSVQLHWNTGSTGLLVNVQADVEETTQSYYAEPMLHYLTVDDSQNLIVQLRKEGPVHDVQWSCSGNEFAVVYGSMPARATIFDKKCMPLLDLGEGPYNAIRWNPKGSHILLAGHGNLMGDLAVWDYLKEEQLCFAKSESWLVTSEWSPNGDYFFTATTAPRVKGNMINIFDYNGVSCFKKAFRQLDQVDWKPESPDNKNKPVKSSKTPAAKNSGSGRKKN